MLLVVARHAYVAYYVLSALLLDLGFKVIEAIEYQLYAVKHVDIVEGHCLTGLEYLIDLSSHLGALVEGPRNDEWNRLLVEFDTGDALLADAFLLVLHHDLEYVIQYQLLVLVLLLEFDGLVNLG